VKLKFIYSNKCLDSDWGDWSDCKGGGCDECLKKGNGCVQPGISRQRKCTKCQENKGACGNAKKGMREWADPNAPFSGSCEVVDEEATRRVQPPCELYETEYVCAENRKYYFKMT